MRVCMVVPDAMVKGGIASVVNGYREYDFKGRCEIAFIESYCNGSKWKKLCKGLAGYLRFFREVSRNRPDIVHIHSSFGPSFYRKMPFIYMAAKRRIPVVNHIHGAEFDLFYSRASERKKNLIRKIYRKCSRLIALSDEWKESLTEIVPGEMIRVIGNYVVIPEEDDSGGFPKPDRGGQILFLGEIGERKGCYDIPLILHKVREQCGSVRMVMAGDGEIDRVKTALKEKNLEGQVSFTGWTRGEEKKRLLEESSIFLFPSYFEGVPIAVLEAMAYGLSIVTTRVGGIPGLIKDGISGWLYEPGDIEGLAGGVVKLLGDSQLRQDFSEKARADAKARFGIGNHVEQLLQLYQEVLEDDR